jgi:hypothetical protein
MPGSTRPRLRARATLSGPARPRALTRGRGPSRMRGLLRPLAMAGLWGILLAAVVSRAPEAAAQIQPYGQVVPAGAESRSGLFDVHMVNDRLLFEIPDSILGRDMVIMSRIAKTQDGLGLGGENLAPNMAVRWERRGDRILLRAVSHSSTADPDDNVYLAVQNGNFAPILHSLAVRAEGEGTSVVDVTDLYLGDSPTFSLPRQRRQQLGVRNYDRDRSWLEFARTFPINVELRVVRTYAADNPPSNQRGGSISFEVNHSMILLPEEPMMPRHYDERVGLSAITVTNYSSDFQGVRPERYLRRYRLEPSDPEAFARGELVEPVQPWVWYLDPATPAEWIPYFREGLLEWNAAFEMAGFKNAIQVHVAPTEDEDPEFSLLDARYSVVRYVATPIRSANAGGDVVDPRSGEVIRAHMNMYQGILERLRWLLVSQLATAYPQYQTHRMSQEDMGEALRYVVSHEIAHAIGLPHNQRANFAFPIDSIRNPDFVDRMGHSASSVGRTRYNYTLQPGDGVAPERAMGLWDQFAVMYAYRPIPEARTADEELPVINQWITERAHLPWFRFGSALFGIDSEWDPHRMTEGISDDPVRAAELGMRNLRIAHEQIMNWVLDEGDDYYELETHHLQFLTQWNRYAEHAAAAVGGFWTHHKRVGEEGPIYTPVEAAYQREAMRFLDEHVFQTPHWALQVDQLRRLEHVGAVERIRAYQVLAVERVMNHNRLARLIEQEAFDGDAAYPPADMLDDLRRMLWRELASRGPIDTFRRNLQRGYLAHIHHLLNEAETRGWPTPDSGNLRVSRNNDPPLNADLHLAQSDIRPLLRDQLRLLRAEIQAALGRGVADRNTRIHLEDALERIDAAL